MSDNISGKAGVITGASSALGEVMNEANGKSLMDRGCIAAGATLAGLAVILGAFGAHALKGHMGGDALGWWQTAVEYQMWHALAVLTIGLSGLAWARLSAWLLTAGVLLFSGSLYAMALGGSHWLGAVTPLGGVAMISGWALLAFRAGSRRY